MSGRVCAWVVMKRWAVEGTSEGNREGTTDKKQTRRRTQGCSEPADEVSIEVNGGDVEVRVGVVTVKANRHQVQLFIDSKRNVTLCSVAMSSFS
jgi:hypothetical protein